MELIEKEVVKKKMKEAELIEFIKDDPRYIPLTPKHWQNGLTLKSQLKHYENKMWIWEEENKEAVRVNGAILKEYTYKQRRGEL